MFRLIPAPLHRLLLRIADRTRRRWWRHFPSTRPGVLIVALDPRGRVLLVRHSYGSGEWMPPGGGGKRGEAPVAAAQREAREEFGAVLACAQVIWTQADGLLHAVAGRLEGEPVADGREIVEVGLFAEDDLPHPMTPRHRAAVPGWVRTAAAAFPPPLEA